MLILIIGFLLLYAQTFNSSPIFPTGHEEWNKVLTGYLVFFSVSMIGVLILAPEVAKKLGKANYWKSFWLRFIPCAIVSLIFFAVIQFALKSNSSINLYDAVKSVPFWVLIIHALIVTQIEEILFGGLLYTAIIKKAGATYANIITAFLFSLFHYGKTGGNIAVLITYIPLRFIFNYARNNGIPGLNRIAPKLFGATPETQQANAGVHFGWNAFIIGLFPWLR